MLGDYINTCTVCGREFHTTTGKRLMCSDCIRAENEKTIKDAEIRHLEKVRKSRKTRKASGLPIAELLGLSVNAYICGLIDSDTAGLDLSAPAADQIPALLFRPSASSEVGGLVASRRR